MNINPTNLISNNNTSFDGKIIIKGKISKEIFRLIENSDKIRTLTDGFDVVIRTNKHRAGYYDKKHPYLSSIYKLTFSRYKENSKMGKILDFLHIVPRNSLTKNYHSSYGTMVALKDWHIDNLVKRFSKNKN